MHILVIALVLLVIWFKFKSSCKNLFEKIRGGAKVEVRVKPGHYRNYTPYVNITEIVHYEILVNLGLAKIIVQTNYKDLQELLLANLPDALAMGGFCSSAKKVMAEKQYEHAAVFGLFFDELDKTYQNKSKLEKSNILKAIEFAIED